MSSVENKRVFLIASPDAALRESIDQVLRSNITGVSTFFAQDGAEALFKAENSPPHLAILTDDLLKTPTVDLVRRFLRFKERLATIVIAPTHDEELFMDQVVTGQVQFLAGIANADLLLTHVNRALNWVSFDEKSIYRSKFMAKDEILIRQGEEGEFVYVLRHGRLRAFRTDEGNGQTPLGYIEPGEFVGEMAYINGERRSASVVCLTEAELIEIPKAHLDAVLFSKPAWSKALMKTLSRRLKRSNLEKAK